jgi:hypothetical protein
LLHSVISLPSNISSVQPMVLIKQFSYYSCPGLFIYLEFTKDPRVPFKKKITQTLVFTLVDKVQAQLLMVTQTTKKFREGEGSSQCLQHSTTPPTILIFS